MGHTQGLNLYEYFEVCYENNRLSELPVIEAIQQGVSEVIWNHRYMYCCSSTMRELTALVTQSFRQFVSQLFP